MIESLNPTLPKCYGDDFFSRAILPYCVLKVPEVSLDAYRAADTWCDFVNIEELSKDGGIDGIDADNRVVVARYDVNGREVDADYRGIVIVRYNDGSVEKMVKQ